ncbi:ArsR/SmtB family transcription factor [Brucella intermedia]|uniref:Regulatory protein ArsR n=1 Tax=Brucella intermedia M86 TaxID=1234597 RepID=M5JSR1_9HYPH|nr:metalloregulator ArsR/SmtB family transcription factor [Brucella intermedia]ELT51235.1 regulatory protein ArsR [Brucella intermedia M86]
MSDQGALSLHKLTELSETFRLLGDPSRLRILIYCLDGPKPVTQIADALGLSQSLVSHHLRLLRSARLVRGERHSRQIFYEIADKHVSGVINDMIEHVLEDGDAFEDR